MERLFTLQQQEVLPCATGRVAEHSVLFSRRQSYIAAGRATELDGRYGRSLPVGTASRHLEGGGLFKSFHYDSWSYWTRTSCYLAAEGRQHALLQQVLP